jgi:hypothetical protein
MAIDIMFTFSYGLKEPLRVPREDFEYIERNLASIRENLDIEISLPDGKYMESFVLGHFPDDDDGNDALCDFVGGLASFTIHVDNILRKAHENPCTGDCVTMSKEYSQVLFPLLRTIRVPFDRWTKEYHVKQMNAVYETLRGRKGLDGVTMDCKPFDEKQAAYFVWLMDVVFEFDRWDNDLSLPVGGDSLLENDEYYWCENCGAVEWEDIEYLYDDNGDLVDDGPEICPHCKNEDGAGE